MTKKDFKLVSKHFTPQIADKILALELEIDNYCLNKIKYKPSEYKVAKKIVTGILNKEAIPFVIKRISEEMVNYVNARLRKADLKLKSKKNIKKRK